MNDMRNDSDLNLTRSGVSSKEHFALRKRLLVPRWWLEGTLVYQGLKKQKSDSWLNSFLLSRLGTIVVGVPVSATKIFESLCLFWSACVHKVSLHPSVDEVDLRAIEVDLKDLGFLPSPDGYDGLAAFQTALLMPFENLRVVRERVRSRFSVQNVHLESAGALASVVRSVSFVGENRLRVDFHESLRRILTGEIFESSRESVRTMRRDVPSVVSLNPNVLRSLGRKGSIRRLALYFYFEIEKYALEQCDDGVSPILLSDPSLQGCGALVQEYAREGKALYDLGALGWLEKLPSMRLSDLKVRKGLASPCVLVAAMPRFGGEVVEYESHVNKALTAGMLRPFGQTIQSQKSQGKVNSSNPISEFVRGGQLEISRSRGRFAEKTRQSLIKSGSGPTRRQDRILRLANQQRRSVLSEQPSMTAGASSRVDAEKVEILKLAQYYESLSPAQRQDLDREMRLLQSPSEFKRWLKPLLDRLH